MRFCQLLFNRNDKYMFRLPKKASLAKLGSRHPLPNPYYIDCEATKGRRPLAERAIARGAGLRSSFAINDRKENFVLHFPHFHYTSNFNFVIF